jgi:hypothetical protein
LKGAALAIHLSTFRSLGFSGAPGWIDFDAQRSAAVTRSL